MMLLLLKDLHRRRIRKEIQILCLTSAVLRWMLHWRSVRRKLITRKRPMTAVAIRKGRWTTRMTRVASHPMMTNTQMQTRTTVVLPSTVGFRQNFGRSFVTKMERCSQLFSSLKRCKSPQSPTSTKC